MSYKHISYHQYAGIFRAQSGLLVLDHAHRRTYRDKTYIANIGVHIILRDTMYRQRAQIQYKAFNGVTMMLIRESNAPWVG